MFYLHYIHFISISAKICLLQINPRPIKKRYLCASSDVQLLFASMNLCRFVEPQNRKQKTIYDAIFA